MVRLSALASSSVLSLMGAGLALFDDVLGPKSAGGPACAAEKPQPSMTAEINKPAEIRFIPSSTKEPVFPPARRLPNANVVPP
jgi:hypothetical protein